MPGSYIDLPSGRHGDTEGHYTAVSAEAGTNGDTHQSSVPPKTTTPSISYDSFKRVESVNAAIRSSRKGFFLLETAVAPSRTQELLTVLNPSREDLRTWYALMHLARILDDKAPNDL
jgi:hypothetical protein